MQAGYPPTNSPWFRIAGHTISCDIFMALSFTCPHCGTGIWVADSLVGKTIACQDCGRAIAVSKAMPTVKGTPTARTPQKSASQLPVALCVLAVVVTLCGTAIAIAFIVTPKNETARANEPTISTPAIIPTLPSHSPHTNDPLPTPPTKLNTPIVPPTTVVEKTPVKPPEAPVKRDRLDSATLATLKGSTVYLERDDANGGGSGTGWFGLEPGLIITNAHVIGMKLPGSKEPSKLTVYVDSGVQGKQRVFEGPKVKILAVDRDMDLAVLQIVNESDLPAPLPIAPSTTLNELNKLVVLGFPGGRRLAERNRSDAPPIVTVTETTVSAFRSDSGGNRYSIQIQGGVVHGNSGGPVFDMNGNVVGVAVRVDINPATGQMTNIAYAVPAEYVTGLLAGRAVEADVGQPYHRDEKVVFPVTVRCADAMKRLKSVGIATWLADPSEAPRPPGDTRQAIPGDANVSEVALTYDKEKRVAVGEVEFTKRTDGRAYWIQPYYSNAVVSKWYTAGNAIKIQSPPVDRVSGMLQPRYAVGSERKLRVIQTAEFAERSEVNGVEQNRNDVIGQDVRLTEQVEKPTSGGNHATLSQTLIAFVPQYKQFKQDTELPKSLREVTGGVSRWSANLVVGRQGSVVSASPPSHTAAPDTLRQDQFKRFAGQIQTLTQDTLIPLPGKQLSAGESWTGTRSHRFVLELDHLMQDRPLAKGEHRGHLVREDERYTYLGKRLRGGRTELVIQVDGVLRPTADETAVCGVVTGTAVLDESDGTLTELDLKREFDLDTSFGGATRKAIGTETFKVTREK